MVEHIDSRDIEYPHGLSRPADLDGQMSILIRQDRAIHLGLVSTTRLAIVDRRGRHRSHDLYLTMSTTRHVMVASRIGALFCIAVFRLKLVCPYICSHAVYEGS